VCPRGNRERRMEIKCFRNVVRDSHEHVVNIMLISTRVSEKNVTLLIFVSTLLVCIKVLTIFRHIRKKPTA